MREHGTEGGREMTEKIWLKQYPEEIPKEIQYDERTLQSYLSEAGEEANDQIAIHFMGKELTYAEMMRSAKRLGAYLQKVGIEKGDRIAVMLPNTPQAAIAFYGVLYAGAIIVQTNPLYTERELEYQLQDSGAKAIITLKALYPRVANIRQRTELEHIITTGVEDYLPFPKNKIYPSIERRKTKVIVDFPKDSQISDFKQIVDQEQGELTEYDFAFDDVAVLQYTGGTTGPPKGVMLTHENLVANVSMCNAWLYKSEKGKEVVLGVIPLFHVYGMTTVLLLSVMQHYKMVLMPQFKSEEVLKVIEKQKPTFFPGAPTIYIGLLNDPKIEKYNLSSIEACISGSAPLPVEVKKKFEQLTGGRLVEGYGLTETSPVTHANFVWKEQDRVGSIGVPWPNTDACILGPHDSDAVGSEYVGEIAIKGPQVMKGYWNRPQDTEETFRDGWLLTGDLGYMDEDGYFYIVDRKKDMVIAGGFNIYPREIEEVFYEHEAVQEVVVIGIPDPYRGETVKAFIVLRPGYEVTEKELNTFARKHLAAFKVPHYYEFREDLPKTAIGKILRRVLIDEEKKKTKNK